MAGTSQFFAIHQLLISHPLLTRDTPLLRLPEMAHIHLTHGLDVASLSSLAPLIPKLPEIPKFEAPWPLRFWRFAGLTCVLVLLWRMAPPFADLMKVLNPETSSSGDRDAQGPQGPQGSQVS